jgi:DNA-binding response OmpR family regulator
MSQHRGKSRVLVVDDEFMIADTLALILNHEGFETTVAYSGETAVEIATTLKPDAAIIDVVLGTMSGIEAAILIRDGSPGCKVLMFTGQPVSEALIQSAKLKGLSVDFLEKPVPPRLLLERLHAMD